MFMSYFYLGNNYFSCMLNVFLILLKCQFVAESESC